MSAGWQERTRAAYDEVAADYAELLRDELAGKPFDRAMLTAFAELSSPNETRPLADLGCGPGRISAFLRDQGAPVLGVDLSPGMIDVARREVPGIRFEIGSLIELPLPDASVSGALAWYSLIHIPDAELPLALGELRRILVPGGYALIAFQIGNAPVTLRGGYGHDIELELHRRTSQTMRDALLAAGFELVSVTEREPQPPEKTRQAYLLAHA